MFWRLPIIRHIRWLILCRRIEQHYQLWRSLGYLPVHRHFDDEVLDAIWRGER
jgi:hypothetical protein